MFINGNGRVIGVNLVTPKGMINPPLASASHGADCPEEAVLFKKSQGGVLVLAV